MEKIAVFGRGFLGSNIFNELKKSQEVFGTRFSNLQPADLLLDIRNIESINDSISRIKPDLIINCIADTRVDFLEKHPDIAFSINAKGAKNVASIAQKNNIRLIHISTDAIFDGTKGNYSEEDNPNPLHVYGKSKLKGEEFVQNFCDNYIIVRTNFYGHNPEGKSLFDWILQNLKQNKEFIGFDDIIFTPLEISNLSKMIAELLDKDFKGILNLCSDEKLTKYQFAVQIAESLGFNTDLIKRGSIDDVNQPLQRPKNTSLSNKKAREFLSTRIITIKDWLENNKNFFKAQNLI